jgi:Kef-type K+ transport system membrane component KefB
MQADIIPLLAGLLIFLASLVSLGIGMPVAIIEILLGAICGNLGLLRAEDWMIYLAGFGGIVLTFLAGTEIDVDLMREKFKESALIGTSSFIAPFAGVFLYAYYLAGWSLHASLIAGTALSTTSLAVVYSVLVETGLSRSEIGKTIMAATFITDMSTAIALSVLFIKPTLYTLAFIVVSLIVIFVAVKFSHIVFDSPLKNKVIEPEIKYIFLLLLTFMYFADLGAGHAVLPAFALGLLMSRHFCETGVAKEVRNRLRTVAYSIITPVFFVVGGLKLSIPLILSAAGLFMVLFIIKIVMKFGGVYYLAKKYIPGGSMYTTLLMSTGLTFGTIASVFGLNAGLIDQVQYSVLVGVVVVSAVVPTFIAQKWFKPVHSEDILDLNGRMT